MRRRPDCFRKFKGSKTTSCRRKCITTRESESRLKLIIERKRGCVFLKSKRRKRSRLVKQRVLLKRRSRMITM